MMKLILSRAMLSKADILLMDEPTNHLDTASVQWLVDYINNGSDTTYMIVSHVSNSIDFASLPPRSSLNLSQPNPNLSQLNPILVAT